MMRMLVGLSLVVFCYCHQLPAENKVLKADLERAIVGKPMVSKILLGGKARPQGYHANYPVNTLFYPDTDQVTYRVDSGLMHKDVGPAEMKQQFDQGTSFRVANIDLKDDRLELSLRSGNGDSAKLRLMLGDGWQSKSDVSSIQAQLALVLVLDQQPEPLRRKTSARPSILDTPSTGQQTQQDTGTYQQDAAALEAQYKTCTKHYSPADKCTPDIYRQLKDTDEAPLDPLTASALQAVKYYETRLKNPASLQVRTAYVTYKGDICLEVGAQNGMGGMTVSKVVYTSKGRWLDEGGFGGALAQQNSGGVDRWQDVCTKGIFHPKLFSGTDVTEKVNQALKDAK